MAKRKKSELSKAKDACWKAFSKYIRTRDCIRFNDSLYDGMCITCRREYPFKQLQAGHFIGGRNNAVLFDERIVYSQCGSCNVNPPYGLGGNYVEYTLFMMNSEGYTKEGIEELTKLKHAIVKYTPDQLHEMKKQYKERTKELEKEWKAKH